MFAARLATVGLCAALLFAPTRARADDAPRGSDSGTSQTGCSCAAATARIVLFPGGRLQIDSAFFRQQTPKSGAFVRRARAELRGWLGPLFYFDVSGDFAPAPAAGADVAPSALPAADEYLAFAPFGDRLIFQAGQFDVPFTLENRTSDAYTDFIERAMVARSLGAPRNKEVGVMVNGLLGDGRFYYSAGLFNGEGPEFRNIDNQSDTIGRLVATPFGLSDGWWSRLSLGGSVWYGNHILGPEAAVQATPGGMVFFEPHWTSGQTTPQSYELHEQGTATAIGGELNLPIGDRFGLRGEVVWKRQHLAEDDTSQGLATPVGAATLDGLSGYGEILVLATGGRPAAPRARAGAAPADRRFPAPAAGRRVAARRAGGDPEGESDQRQPDAGGPRHRHHARDLRDGGRQLLARPFRPALGQLHRQRMERHLDHRHGAGSLAEVRAGVPARVSPCRSRRALPS